MLDKESSSLDWMELVGDGVKRDSSSDVIELSSLLEIHTEFPMDSRVSTAACSPGLLHRATDSFCRTIMMAAVKCLDRSTVHHHALFFQTGHILSDI